MPADATPAPAATTPASPPVAAVRRRTLATDTMVMAVGLILVVAAIGVVVRPPDGAVLGATGVPAVQPSPSPSPTVTPTATADPSPSVVP
jgi:hypothetical protein